MSEKTQYSHMKFTQNACKRLLITAEILSKASNGITLVVLDSFSTTGPGRQSPTGLRF